MQYQKSQEALGTKFMNCFSTEQISDGIILQPLPNALAEIYYNHQKERTVEISIDLSVEEYSCKVIVFLVTTIKLLQHKKYNIISKL